MDWFYADAGKQVGPIEEAVFRDLANAGVILQDTLVWRAGMANWQPFHIVQGQIQQPPALPLQSGVQYCSECGKPHPTDELAAFGSTLVCANCKPLYAQKLREGI